MSHQITVQPCGATYTAEADETLLDAALRQGITIPYGCKNGACSACKASVLAGEVDPGPYQPHALNEQEIAAGKVLLCCAHAKSDLTIENRQAVLKAEIPVKLMPVRVEAMEKRAPDVITLNLRLPASETFTFRAGQFIDVLLADGQRRSYSIANAPEQAGVLELHIRRVPGGRFTGQVFEQMKVKDILRFEGPHGGFYLRDDSKKPVILLASGTGFAPVKAMVEHAIAQNSDRPLHIYWGCRKEIDLYLSALPTAWAAEHAHIRYTPVLSEPESGWRGRTGFVHQAVVADYPDLSRHEVYACGAPAMIDAARQDFANACKLPEEAFFSDAFTFAPQGKTSS
ncbi:MAG: CDP-6-deoxy-delta-3,4-glucoseen reductase [Zoogloeaceae bacterium]|jgi:CDP-4-dehydro-6-deoxyglucose reductase|nr:CDP-6-deoxy-delta-3,4-glucoseen reductase [Zoogloeaceae bacterium]